MSFNRKSYERLVEIARRLHQTGVTAAERRCLGVELFTMAENVIGQLPPLRAGGSGVARHHELVVDVECDDPQGSQQAQDRLERWISTFGHTATGHGFAFLEPARAAPRPELRLPPNFKDVTAEAGITAIVPFPAGGKKQPD